ncbi:hypothetical protein AAID98_00660 [Campylobacter coli]
MSNKELRVAGKKVLIFEGKVKNSLMSSVETKVKCVQNINNIKEFFIYDMMENFFT